MKRRSNDGARALRAGLAGLTLSLLLALAGAPPALASHIETPEQLRDSCQTLGTVVLDHSTKIFTSGRRTPIPVATGCTIVLGPSATLETEYMPLRFAGPLVIRSTSTAAVSIVNSIVFAPAITIDLPAPTSSLTLLQSTLQATAGDISIGLGPESTFAYIQGLPIPGVLRPLAATGDFRLSGGYKLAATLGQLSAQVGDAFSIVATGDESHVAVHDIDLRAGGPIVVTSSGAKGVLETSGSFLFGGTFAHFAFPGNESSVVLKQSFVKAPQSVSIDVGGAGTTSSKIEIAESALFDTASIAVRAGVGGQLGSLKLDKGLLRSSGDILIESGASGTTDVVDGRVQSQTRVRASTGFGGTCNVTSGVDFGSTPTLELCLP